MLLRVVLGLVDCDRDVDVVSDVDRVTLRVALCRDTVIVADDEADTETVADPVSDAERVNDDARDADGDRETLPDLDGVRLADNVTLTDGDSESGIWVTVTLTAPLEPRRPSTWMA